MKSTILIVDDRKTDIDMLSVILRDDYTIMAAISGENALKLLEKRTPDLVLLDIFMPGLDGFGVLQHIKSNAALAALPVIFITGEHDEKIEEKGLSMGAVDYIKKPYSEPVVRYKVRNHLAFKSYKDDLEALVDKRTLQLTSSREAIIMGMSLMSESHDPVTSGHIERIKAYTRILVDQILTDRPDLLTPEHANQIVLYSPLHDMGKIEVPDEILAKQGMLTPEEHKIMQMHTLTGGELLHKTELFFFDKSDGNDLRTAVEIAESHHERYDGSGYPRGLTGEEIPLSARIVGLADVYDGLRNKKPYKKDFTHEEAVEIILHGGESIAPSHFDPVLLEIFDKVKEKLK